MPERLLDDHAAPLTFGRLGHAAAVELVHHAREALRGHREVESPVPVNTLSAIRLCQGRGKGIEGGIVVECAGDEMHPVG